MKKVWMLVTFLLLIALTAFGLFACNNTPEQTAELGALKVEANENGFAFSYDGDLSFFCSVDGAAEKEFFSGFYFDFSEDLGEHVVKAYAKNASGEKIAEGTFTYKTAAVSLSDLTVSGKTVSWTAAAAFVYAKESGDFVLVSGDSFTAKSDDATVRVKAEGGYDEKNAIYYVGSTVTKSARVVPERATLLAAPSLRVNGKNVTWGKVADATSYAVSYDNGSFTTQTSASLSDVIGNHTIEVKAVGDGVFFADSNVSVLEYRTERPELKLSKIATNGVMLSAPVGVCSVSADGTSFTALSTDEYYADSTMTAYFRAEGGFDSDKKIFYVQSDVSSISLLCAAESSLDVESVSSQTVSGWSVKQSNGSAWQSTSANLSVCEKYDGASALRLNIKNDTLLYRFSKTYSATDAYNYLSFYYRGDGVSRLSVGLSKSGAGVSIKNDLGVMPAYWVKVNLRFDSVGWMWNDMPLLTMWENKNSELEDDRPVGVPQVVTEAYSVAELAAFFNTIELTVSGNAPAGAATALYLDDFAFGFDPETVSATYQPLYDLGASYVAIETLESERKNELLLNLEGEDAFRLRFYSDVLKQNVTLTGACRLDDGNGTLTLEDLSADFAMTLSFLENGRSIVVKSIEGENVWRFVPGTRFDKAADLALDFEQEDPLGAVKGWTAYTYLTESGEWSALSSSPAEQSILNGEGVLRLTTGKDLKNKVVYHEVGDTLGLANYFAVNFGNCDVDADDILVKFIAEDVNGDVYYLKGSAVSAWACPAGVDLVTYEHTLPSGIFLRSVVLIVEYRGSNAVSHLYVDHLTAAYHVEASLVSDYPAPEIQKGAHALTFSHKETDVMEYSLNWSEEWIRSDSNVYEIPAEDGAYTIRVRGVMEDGTYTQVANYSFTVEKVYISTVTVTIGEEGQTANWTTNGILSVRVDTKTESGYQEGEAYLPFGENSFFTDNNVIINLHAEGYFDEEEDKYYVGEIYVSRTIIIDDVLGSPVIAPFEQGITWEPVQYANAYAVSVNDGDAVIYEDCSLAYAIYEGTYSVRVQAVFLENGVMTAYGNFSNVYTYSVKYVSISPVGEEPFVDKDTVSWTANALKVYVKDSDGEYVENTEGTYQVKTLGSHDVLIKATPGFSLEQNVYYYSEDDVIVQMDPIIVEKLLTPTLLLNESKNGLYWAYLNDLGEVAHTVQDMKRANPFLTYRLSINGGEWFMAETDAYLFPSVQGAYSVRVMAKGNDANYRDSEPSASFEFEVKLVSLTDISVEKGSEQSTASYDYVALTAERKIGVNGHFATTTEKTYTTSVTIYIEVRVSGGWDNANAVYYAGDTVVKSKQIIKPERLATPELSHTSTGISWKKVDHVTGYRVVINGQTVATVKSTSYDYTTDIGDYDVEVYAVNEVEAEQYPESEAATITYHVSAVALSELVYQGATISWTYNGMLWLYIGDEDPKSSDWEPYDQSEYVNDSGNQATVWVEARAGYRYETTESGDEIFLYRGNTVQGKQVVKNFELKAPELAKAGSTLTWAVNNNATCYKYKLLPIDATEADIAAAEADLSDWTTLAVNQNSFLFNKEVHNNKLLLLRSIGNGNNIADSPTTVCGLRVIFLTVDDSLKNEGEVSWEKSGITSIQTITQQNGMPHYSDFESIDETVYRPSASQSIVLKCTAGFNTKEGIWYFGDTFNDVFKETLSSDPIAIIVPIRLNAPEVNMLENGVSIGAVANADVFVVTVNDEAPVEVPTSNRLLNFKGEVGTYVLKVSATSSTDPDQYPASVETVFTYYVRAVTLSAVEQGVGGVANFTANGIVYVKEADGEFVMQPIGTTSYYPAVTVDITVEARAGVDVGGKTVYIGEAPSITKNIVVPVPLDTPKLTKGAEFITISSVVNADRYYVKIDNGDWNMQTGRTVNYPTSDGDHTVYVKAGASDSAQYPDSAPTEVSFATSQVVLQNFARKGATFSWEAEAFAVKYKVNKDSFTNITTGSYTLTAEGTYTFYVRAYKGFVSSSNTYFACTNDNGYLEASEANIKISKLDKPKLSVSGNKITWSAVSGANGYEVKVNSGSYATQSATEKALSNQEGKHKVYVRAKGDGATLLSSDAEIVEYTVKNVTLSDISVVGTTASWSAVAYKTYLSVDNGSYGETTKTSYTPTAQGSHSIKVKAEGGWNSSESIYYYTNKAIEKDATVKLYKLSTPVLKTNAKGVTWDAVSNATTYSVKVDSGSYKTQNDRSVTFSTSTGSHTVSVYAVGAASSGYQDSSDATFTYETKQTALSFVKKTDTMTAWTATGLKTQYSTDGTNYTDAQFAGYTATANGNVYFRTLGGYDDSAKVFYNGNSKVETKSFTLPGMCIGNNFEGGASGWKKEIYETSGWNTTTASAVSSVSDAYGAGSAIMFKSYANTMGYRFGYHFGNLPATYKSLSFDIKLHEYVSTGSTVLRFEDSDGGHTYVDYNLANLSLSAGVWYHVTINFEDNNLIINMGGTEYTPSDAINNKLVGKTKYYEKIKALDHMYITVKGNVANGAAVYTYIDNFQFSTAGTATGKSRITGIEKDFNDGTVGANYTASGWKAYKYDNSFVENANVLKIEDGAKVLSLWCGGTTGKVTYNVSGNTLGEFNHFSINVGTEAASVSYSIELVTESGSSIYVAGGADYRATLTNTGGSSGMKTIVFNFDATKIKGIIVYASESTGNAHFYMDNIVFSKF